MQKIHIRVALMLAGATLVLGVQAQTIYRCGNFYSQVPCPGAAPLQLNDPRQPEQKQQTDAASEQTARLAQTMAQTRTAEEKRLLASQQPITATTPEKPEPGTPDPAILTPKRLQPKHKKPAAFIAEVPGSEKRGGQKKKLRP
ncbi:hypothetical protein [Rhodoferax sp.]|uniref:hypothetical protein n=1 Tax=Rhodoferax sp. TaxID=50421 RepID=UPI0026102871|nr:hypothetical protein [Rhodoferax sp.]MDD3936820.1 hypothetical protein [Rhodoferax sp.]